MGCNTVLLPDPNRDEVLLVDSITGVFGTPIPVGDIQNDQQLTGIAISPDARTAYVTTDTEVTPIDLGSRTLGEPIFVPTPSPGTRIAYPIISPDGRTMFVAHPADIVKIDLTTGTVGSPLPAGPGSTIGQMAFEPDGTRILVGDGSGTAVTPIDVATMSKQPPIELYSWPGRLTITPDGRFAYVATDAGGAISVIDLSIDAVVATVPGNDYVGPLIANPDGRTVLAGTHTDLVSIDVATNTPRASTPFPWTASAVSRPDGRTAVVASKIPPLLATVDLTTMTSMAPVPLPDASAASSIGQLPPDQAPRAAFTAHPAPTGSPTTFDATSSSVDCGTIDSYRWDFGDGGPPEETSGPITTHTYKAAGSHVVTVVETDSAGTSTARVSTGQSVLRNGGPSAIATVAVDVPRGSAVAAAPVAVAETPQITG